MHGGHFDYQQFRIEDIASEIETVIAREWNGPVEGEAFNEATLVRFQEAVQILRRAAQMAQSIDMLLSGDDSEETFNEEWMAAFRSKPL